MQTAGGGNPSPAAVNLAIRQMLIQQCIDSWQQIQSGTITTGAGSVINVPVRPVGLVKRFLVQLAIPVVNPAGPTQTLGKLGSAAALSNVTLTDLATQTRVNTPGWHLMTVSSVKRRKVFGAAYTTDTPLGYGDNIPLLMAAPATIASNTTGTVYVHFEVPVTYTDHDLRGCIYAAVTNANALLQFTINPNIFAISTTTDPTFAMYQSSTTTPATLGTITYTVYQNYLDQLPRNPQNGAPFLPLGDLSVAYLLSTSPFSGLVANSDNPFPYPNFRDIMSSTLIYDNGGTLNTGTDISYFSLQTANFTNIWKFDPYTAALRTRMQLGDDCPPGMWYFDHRDKPINTIQYGNMALLMNPTTVNAGANVQFGFEMLAIIGQVTSAGSLPGT